MLITTLFPANEAGCRRHRIPALLVTTKGTVLAFCEARRRTGADDDEIDIVLKRSFDNGKTWSDRQIVVTDGDRTCGNPCPIVDRETGSIVLLFCKENQTVFVTQSEDEGESWTTPVEITADIKDPAWTYLGTGPGHGIQLAGGRLLAPSWSDESPGPATWRPAGWGKIQSSVVFYSDDHGATWRSGPKMTTDASDECEAVELADGSIYGTLRSRQDRFRRAFSRSHDSGNSWTDVQYDDALPEPSCQGSIVAHENDRVLIAHPAATDERARLTVRISEDGCRTWPVARVLYEDASAYSDLTVTFDDHLLCLFEADRYERLALARFRVDWVEQGE
tara:strand:- start:9564 stop:10568 length:1005 start_codon:yes stop_codon:yes gene_type:complete